MWGACAWCTWAGQTSSSTLLTSCITSYAVSVACRYQSADYNQLNYHVFEGNLKQETGCQPRMLCPWPTDTMWGANTSHAQIIINLNAMCCRGSQNKKQIASHSCWPANTMGVNFFTLDSRRVLATAPKAAPKGWGQNTSQIQISLASHFEKKKRAML